MMEDHIVDSLGVGIGILGEQGPESIHTVFNKLGRIYANITNGVARLKSMVTPPRKRIMCRMMKQFPYFFVNYTGERIVSLCALLNQQPSSLAVSS